LPFFHFPTNSNTRGSKITSRGDSGRAICISAARGGGIATAMLGLMEHEIKKAGVKKIFLEVSAENAPAIALYKKCGFIQNGRRPKYYDGIDAVLMKKEI
jgi:ribosomal-protein-alanine N-acetyltransferase